jgi:carboxymethylenebutenolidase
MGVERAEDWNAISGLIAAPGAMKGRHMGRNIKRIVLIAGLGVLALVAALFGSIAVDGLLGRERLVEVTNIRIPNAGGPEVRAFVARPSTPGPHPAVIMIHEFWGLNESIVGKARALAEEGYVVVAPDLFRGNSTAWVPRAVFQVVSNPPEQTNVDLNAVFDWLAAQPDVKADRVAAMGFCFGGGASLRFSLVNNRLAATAVFYGSTVADPEALKALPGPVLGIFGGADASIPLSEVRAFEAGLQAAGVPHEITVYEGQPHAFVTSIEDIRRGGIQQRAWNQLLAFLKQSLQGERPAARAVASAASAAYAAGPDWGYLARLALSHLEHRH